MITVDKLNNAIESLAAEVDWDESNVKQLLVEFIREKSMTEPQILHDLETFLRQRIADDIGAEQSDALDDLDEVECDDFLDGIDARHECVAVDDTDEDFDDEEDDEDYDDDDGDEDDFSDEDDFDDEEEEDEDDEDYDFDGDLDDEDDEDDEDFDDEE